METNENYNVASEYKKTANRVSVVTISVNAVLSVLKLLAGIFASSGAMLSDAVHSASDVLSTVVVIVGVNISSRKADKEHRYGHERLECVASIILALILAETGMAIGWNGICVIAGGNYENLQAPGLLALVAAIVSTAVKEWMYWYTRAAAKRINSDALMADAWHHRSDSLSSIGAFVGILGARLGFPVLDPIASVIICLFILKAAFDIFRDATDKMVDKSCGSETEQCMKEVILKQDGVEGIDELKTRLFGARIYVDVEISADGNITLFKAHEIAENVHGCIEREFKTVKHCMVHVNPIKKENDVISDSEAERKNGQT